MDKNILSELKDFIYSQGLGFTLPFPFLFKKKKIDRNTTIQRDLKITGDDADTFLESYSKKFNVDLSKFVYEEYFGDEEHFILRLFNALFKNTKEYKQLTVGELEKAISEGELVSNQ